MFRPSARGATVARLVAHALVAVALVAVAPAVAKAQPSSKPAAQDGAKLEQAKQHMAAGSSFYNDPSGHKCEEALVEFGKAYDLSGSWKALRAMAICELELERDGDAIKHFEEVLRLGGAQIAGDDKSQIERDLLALKSAVATLALTSNRPGALVVATRQPASGLPKSNRYVVPEGGLSLGVHPGSYTFTASVDGMPDVTWKAEIANGAKVERAIEFAPAPPAAAVGGTKVDAARGAPTSSEPERPVPVATWILGSTALASAITSGVFMALSSSAKGEYDDVNGTGTVSVDELETLRDDVVTKSLVADVMLGATALTAGAAVVFYVLRPEVDAGASTIAVVPSLGPTSGGLVVSGSF
jgi:hypothetical protein